MNHWLMKSEPDVFGIDDLARSPRKTTHWDGVRNYQARGFMRDDMRIGDLAFFYHSNTEEPGIAGIVKVVKRGNRLSITPVSAAHWKFILSLEQ